MSVLFVGQRKKIDTKAKPTFANPIPKKKDQVQARVTYRKYKDIKKKAKPIIVRTKTKTLILKPIDYCSLQRPLSECLKTRNIHVILRQDIELSHNNKCGLHIQRQHKRNKDLYKHPAMCKQGLNC